MPFPVDTPVHKYKSSLYVAFLDFKFASNSYFEAKHTGAYFRSCPVPIILFGMAVKLPHDISSDLANIDVHS